MSPALLLLATAPALLTAGTAGAQSGHGPGFGLAFPADQNGYPGPLHVLELKGPLRLTPEQETRVRVLFEAMLAEARRRAARLAAAEAQHLLTHVQTRDVLTETQRRTYHEIRWAAPKHP